MNISEMNYFVPRETSFKQVISLTFFVANQPL